MVAASNKPSFLESILEIQYYLLHVFITSPLFLNTLSEKDTLQLKCNFLNFKICANILTKYMYIPIYVCKFLRLLLIMSRSVIFYNTFYHNYNSHFERKLGLPLFCDKFRHKNGIERKFINQD